MTDSSPRIHPALPALAIAALAVLCYLPSLDGGFLWDDTAVSQNPLLKGGWAGLRNLWLAPSLNAQEEHYWPLTYTVFWAQMQLWGMHPPGFRVVSLLLHAANSVLAASVLRRLGARGAWLAGAIFAVHPVHAESVAWIVELKDVLSALCYLLSFGAFLRFAESRGKRWLVASLAAFAAGMLSKSVVVTLPVGLLIALAWREGRAARRHLPALALFLVLGAAFVALDLAVVAGAAKMQERFTPVERVLIAGRAPWFYLGKLLWPVDLVAVYPKWNLAAGNPLAWFWPAATLALVAVPWGLRRRLGNAPAAATAFYLVTLSPMLGLIPFSFLEYAYAADRFQYLASAGPIALLGAGIASLAPASGGRRAKPAAATAVILVVILSCATAVQALYYRNTAALFRRTVAANPDSKGARMVLGQALMNEEGDLDGARQQFLAALRLDPAYAEAHFSLGVLFVKGGQPAEGARRFAEAARLRPADERTFQNLGIAHSMAGDHRAALDAFTSATRLNPAMAGAHAGRGTALAITGDRAGAIAALRHALALDPGLEEARRNLRALESPTTGSR